MKNLKSKLLASVAMLLVSTVMLTSASFAWFTISTAPEITGLTTTVVTNETLEIALDKAYDNAAAVDTASNYASATATASLSGNVYTWGNQVAMASATNFASLDKTLRPAKLATTFKAPEYGADGRIKYDATKGALAISLSCTGGNADTKGPVNGYGSLVDPGADAVAAAGDLVYGYYIDYWMRSNVGGDVVLSDAAIRDGSTTEANKGGGSTFTVATKGDAGTALKTANEALAANIRVAFQDITPSSPTSKERLFTKSIVEAKTVQGTDDKSQSATFAMNTNDKVVTLTANQAKLIRVYVYLDGENLTNEAASIGTQSITGTVNLQFKIAAVDTSMLTPAAS